LKGTLDCRNAEATAAADNYGALASDQVGCLGNSGFIAARGARLRDRVGCRDAREHGIVGETPNLANDLSS